ncbi:MAG TPA: peptidylprolyl isomerase [Planctomycetes bacterium]|nr:peptidylprolyl isomerase [Planctomycetota bacterium]
MENTLDIHDLDDSALVDARVDIEVSIDGQEAGTLSLEFWPQVAPGTVRNFLQYVSGGFYDGLTFHRVVTGFMVQGGCPQGTGTGSGPAGTIPGEFSQDSAYSHQRGTISMARSNDPDSASCQFFICHDAATFLDGQYAAFGKLIGGENTLDKLASVSVGPGGGGEMSAPEVRCEISRATIRFDNEE